VLWAPSKAHWDWAGAVAKYFFSATCLLQFAKADSVVALSQEEKNNTYNLQRERVNVTCFM
jgi:hypothetical protein